MSQSEDIEQLKRIVMKAVAKMIKDDLNSQPMEAPQGDGNTIIIKESSSSLLFLLMFMLDMEEREERRDQSASMVDKDNGIKIEQLIERVVHLQKINKQMLADMMALK